MTIEPMAIAVGNNAPRDVRLAAAILIYAARDVSMSKPKYPVELSFTSYEEDYDVMVELCQLAAWNPERFAHMQKTLSSVASLLADWGYLTKRQKTRNEEAMENNEPTRWNSYTAPLKCLARLNPTVWKGYSPEWPPVEELAHILRRVFRYEGPVTEWRVADAGSPA